MGDKNEFALCEKREKEEPYVKDRLKLREEKKVKLRKDSVKHKCVRIYCIKRDYLARRPGPAS
jgi:hypothetical protein